MMITPGYQVVLRYQTALYEYRSANNGAPVLAYNTSTNDWKDSEDDFLCPWEDWTLDYEEALDNALTAISRELNAN